MDSDRGERVRRKDRNEILRENRGVVEALAFGGGNDRERETSEPPTSFLPSLGLHQR